jgi:hypothetical protein
MNSYMNNYYLFLMPDTYPTVLNTVFVDDYISFNNININNTFINITYFISITTNYNSNFTNRNISYNDNTVQYSNLTGLRFCYNKGGGSIVRNHAINNNIINVLDSVFYFYIADVNKLTC